MKQIRNSNELKEELARLKALSKEQETALLTQLKEIETSLQPQNILRKGITGMLERNKGSHGFLPMLAGAGVEAGLARLLAGKAAREGLLNLAGRTILQKLAGSILGPGENGEGMKKLFARNKKEETEEEK